MSSRDSVGGGPYVIEEAWPLLGKDMRQRSDAGLTAVSGALGTDAMG
jgi:2'-5' RNA ligase